MLDANISCGGPSSEEVHLDERVNCTQSATNTSKENVPGKPRVCLKHTHMSWLQNHFRTNLKWEIVDFSIKNGVLMELAQHASAAHHSAQLMAKGSRLHGRPSVVFVASIVVGSALWVTHISQKVENGENKELNHMKLLH